MSETQEALARLREKLAHPYDEVGLHTPKGPFCEVRQSDLRLALSLLDRAREVLGPFATESVGFDEAATRFGFKPPKDDVTPSLNFTHAQLRAAAALHAELSE